jgi:hypothetical protein
LRKEKIPQQTLKLQLHSYCNHPAMMMQRKDPAQSTLSFCCISVAKKKSFLPQCDDDRGKDVCDQDTHPIKKALGSGLLCSIINPHCLTEQHKLNLKEAL